MMTLYYKAHRVNMMTKGEKGLLIYKKVGKYGITFFVFKINAHILLVKNL